MPRVPSISFNSTTIVVMIDNETILPTTDLQFVYRENPTYSSVQPKKTILRYEIMH